MTQLAALSPVDAYKDNAINIATLRPLRATYTGYEVWHTWYKAFSQASTTDVSHYETTNVSQA